MKTKGNTFNKEHRYFMSYLNSFFSLIKYHLSLLFIGVLVASSFIANGSQSSNKLPKKINDSKVKEIKKYYYRLTGMLPDKNKSELNQIINKSMDGNYLNENELFNNLFLVPEFTENRLASFISGLSNLQIPSLIAVIGFFIGGFIAAHFLIPLIFG